MTGFEQAFADGERQAFIDKKFRRPRRVRPEGKLNPYGEAWWLGYQPRTLAWAIRSAPVKAPSEVVA